MESLGTRLKRLRNAKNYSAEQVIRAINRKGYDIPRPWTQSTLTKWENDTRTPKAEELRILADYYHVTSDYLLGLDDDPFRFDDLDAIAEYLSLSRAAVDNLCSRYFVGGRISDELFSAILESPLLEDIMKELTYCREGVGRQIHNCDGNPPQKFRQMCIDIAEMYVMKAHKAIDPLLREALHFNVLINEGGEDNGNTEA